MNSELFTDKLVHGGRVLKHPLREDGCKLRNIPLLKRSRDPSWLSRAMGRHIQCLGCHCNVGGVAGAEVAQLYLGILTAPVGQLRGFDKVDTAEPEC
jgi:hypothetical protein